MEHHCSVTSLSIQEERTVLMVLWNHSRANFQTNLSGDTLAPFLTWSLPGLPAPLSCCQAPSPPLMCFPVLSTVRRLGFEARPPHTWRGFLGPRGLEPALPADSPTLLAAGVPAGPHGTGACLPVEDMSSLPWARLPGSGPLSSPGFVYLSFVWGEIGEHQVQ